VTVAGDLRRGCELVAELSLVAEAPRLDGGPTELDSSGLKIHLTDRKHFGAALLHATGSSEHLDQLRALAEHNQTQDSAPPPLANQLTFGGESLKLVPL
jgi:DNA polymerase (family 10)